MQAWQEKKYSVWYIWVNHPVHGPLNLTGISMKAQAKGWFTPGYAGGEFYLTMPTNRIGWIDNGMNLFPGNEVDIVRLIPFAKNFEIPDWWIEKFISEVGTEAEPYMTQAEYDQMVAEVHAAHEAGKEATRQRWAREEALDALKKAYRKRVKNAPIPKGQGCPDCDKLFKKFVAENQGNIALDEFISRYGDDPYRLPR